MARMSIKHACASFSWAATMLLPHGVAAKPDGPGGSIVTISAADIATGNLTTLGAAHLAAQQPFQVYAPAFRTILGASPRLDLVLTAAFPAFHEGGVVTTTDPLTLYHTSNQFPHPGSPSASNGQQIVVSRTTFHEQKDEWTTEVINGGVAPLTLANGGCPFRDGVLWAVQGNRSADSRAGLAYMPTTVPEALSALERPPTGLNSSTSPVVILDNYLGNHLNSPNDVYVTRNGVAYFTDPRIGFAQDVRGPPALPDMVYGFAPGRVGTTTASTTSDKGKDSNSGGEDDSAGTEIRALVDSVAYPNGIVFSPDERTAYITSAHHALASPSDPPASRAIFAFDVVHPSGVPGGAPGEIAALTNQRLFAVPGAGIGDGVHCDDAGNVWVGVGDGVAVYEGRSGRLLGKVLVEGGVANFGFAGKGRLLLMAETKLFLLSVDEGVEPAVGIGERRG